LTNKLFKLRITDEHGVVSLTNISLLASVLKATVMPNASFVDFAIVAVCLMSYQFKRWHSSRQTNEQKFADRITALEHSLNSLKTALTLKR
jgi:hypothetical protein